MEEDSAFLAADPQFLTSALLTVRPESLWFAGCYIPATDLQARDETHTLLLSTAAKTTTERASCIHSSQRIFSLCLQLTSFTQFALEARTEFSLAYGILILIIRNSLTCKELLYSVPTFWHSLSDSNLSRRIVFRSHFGIYHKEPAVTTFHHSPVIKPDWTFVSSCFHLVL